MSRTSVDLAVASAHQVEVADEAPDGRGRQALGAGLVADLVVERRDLGDQVRLLLASTASIANRPVAAASRS